MQKPFSPHSAPGPDLDADQPADQDPEQSDRTTKTRKRSAIWELVETLLLALLIFIAVRSVVLNYRVDGLSMMPTLHDREMLIVNRREYSHIDLAALVNWVPGVSISGEHEWYPFRPPKRGDIIVFTPPMGGPEPYIKRIIGLPGDTVAIHDGSVYINGKRLNEPYLRSDTLWQGSVARTPIKVPEDSVFVMGDNRDNSSDSRVFGPVAISSIIGKAWLAYWPPSEAHIMPQPKYVLQ